MAITVTARGSGSRNTAGESTYTISPSGTIAAGSRAVLCLVCDNSEASGANPQPLTITDSVGNVWTRRSINRTAASVANDGVSTAQFDCLLTTRLLATDTLVITFSTTTVARAYAFWELTTNTANMIVVPQYSTGLATGSSTTPSAITDETIAVGDVVIGVMGAEYGNGTITADTGTTNGSWSAEQKAFIGTTTAGVELSTQYKIQTTAGSKQTFNQTITTTDWATLLRVYTEGQLELLNAGTGSRTTGATTYAVSPTTDIPVGERAILCVAYDNAGAAGVDPYVSISDNAGNVWTADETRTQSPGSAANDGVCVHVFSTLVTTQLSVASVVTISFGAVSVAAVVSAFWKMKAAPGLLPWYNGNSDRTGGASATPSITRSGTMAPGTVLLCVVGAEHGDAVLTVDADVVEGTWSYRQLVNIGTTTAGVKIVTQYKHNLGTSNQIYNLTITSSDWAALALVYVTIPKGRVRTSTGLAKLTRVLVSGTWTRKPVKRFDGSTWVPLP